MIWELWELWGPLDKLLLTAVVRWKEWGRVGEGAAIRVYTESLLLICI